MVKNFLNQIRNIPGWRTSKKIIVFESDDWGSIRFSDIKTIKLFKTNGYPIEKCWMSSNDCLENNDDLSSLLDVITNHKDNYGNHPIFTFLLNPANPDFKKIKENNFTKYEFETFDKTLSRFNNSQKVISIYKEAIKHNLLNIQFHGREHLYQQRWLRDLQNKLPLAIFGFDHNFFGFSEVYTSNFKHSYRSAFDLDNVNDLKQQAISIKEGLEIITSILDVKPSYFLPPDGPFNLSLTKTLSESGIKYIGMPKNHNEPTGIKNQIRKKYFYLGKKINNDLKVITRNASFEPSSPKYLNWVDKCLNEIEISFKWKKPAVISTHRANYTNGLSEINKTNGLKELNLLISKILTKWPEVEFLTSEQLGNLINNKNNI